MIAISCLSLLITTFLFAIIFFRHYYFDIYATRHAYHARSYSSHATTVHAHHAAERYFAYAPLMPP